MKTIKATAAVLAVAITAAAAAGQTFDPYKVMANQARWYALDRQDDASAVMQAAITRLNGYNARLDEAEAAAAANWAAMTQARRDAYAEHHALAVAAGVVGDGHFQAGDARMVHGDAKIGEGDDHYLAGRYLDAKMCYDSPPPAQEEGALQHFDRARMDYSDAKTCYETAKYHADQALAQTQ